MLALSELLDELRAERRQVIGGKPSVTPAITVNPADRPRWAATMAR
jgi:hypothetical protein